MNHHISLSKSRHAPPLPRSLRHLALRRIIRIPLINRQIILRLTCRISNTRPLLHRSLPSPQTSPNPLISASLAFLRNPRATLEVVENPQPHDPRRNNEIDQTRLRAQKEWAGGMHFRRELLQLVKELPMHFRKSLSITSRLKLQKPMPRRNNPGRAEIRPNPGARSLVRVRREKARSVVRIGFFEELADDGAFVEGFVVCLESWDEAARVEG